VRIDVNCKIGEKEKGSNLPTKNTHENIARTNKEKDKGKKRWQDNEGRINKRKRIRKQRS
jgi:hypothetical protein